jgi:hypothetical protein
MSNSSSISPTICFQHVLDGDQAGHAAELVDHDREVVAVAAEFAQQVVEPLALGHEGGGAQQRADVQLPAPAAA